MCGAPQRQARARHAYPLAPTTPAAWPAPCPWFAPTTSYPFSNSLITPLANFEPELGGIDWYVREVLGDGKAKELFYTDSAVKQAYKNYVATFLNRKNTITGVVYKDDPVIMSVEVSGKWVGGGGVCAPRVDPPQRLTPSLHPTSAHERAPYLQPVGAGPGQAPRQNCQRLGVGDGGLRQVAGQKPPRVHRGGGLPVGRGHAAAPPELDQWWLER